MPILVLGGECCLCPTPLGSYDCSDMQIGIAEAYYTCPKNILTLAYAADSKSCSSKSEITAFTLTTTSPTNPPENLLQPINFLKLEDDTGAMWEYSETSASGNVSLTHTFKFKVVASSPTEKAALFKMLGREVAILIKLKNGKWVFINQSGGMIATENAGNSNQSFTEVTITGNVNYRPLDVSYSDAGAWALTNLVPVGLGGLLNL